MNKIKRLLLVAASCALVASCPLIMIACGDDKEKPSTPETPGKKPGSTVTTKTPAQKAEDDKKDKEDAAKKKKEEEEQLAKKLAEITRCGEATLKNLCEAKGKELEDAKELGCVWGKSSFPPEEGNPPRVERCVTKAASCSDIIGHMNFSSSDLDKEKCQILGVVSGKECVVSTGPFGKWTTCKEKANP